MTLKRNEDEDDNGVKQRCNVMIPLKGVIVSVLTAAIIGMGAYIFQRGANTVENLAVVKMDVEVLKTNYLALKDDVGEIKDLSRQIRDDQIRRQRIGK